MRSPDPVMDYETRLERCAKFLPAWFVPRMVGDTWVFGLLLSTGQTLAIECIDNVSQAADGSLWVDVTMHDEPVGVRKTTWGAVVCAPTARTKASVNVAHIVCAIELADT
jgi:hypothetical protein